MSANKDEIVTIRITETICYFSDWALSDLHEHYQQWSGLTPEDEEYPATTEALMEQIMTYKTDIMRGAEDNLEHDGDVQGQAWDWRPEGEEF